MCRAKRQLSVDEQKGSIPAQRSGQRVTDPPRCARDVEIRPGVTVVGLVGDLERGTTTIGAWKTGGEFAERFRTRSTFCAPVARLPPCWENTGWNEARGHKTLLLHANGVPFCAYAGGETCWALGNTG